MNLLIVDDQSSVVTGLLHGISWRMLGIDKVFAAYNAAEARKVFLENTIHIMLCDIEMPGENGIQLLNWMRSQGIDTECIFLTAHGDFEYMQEAIRAKGFDYILQPAPYDEIKKAVCSAIGKVLEQQKRKNVLAYGEAMLDQRSSFRRNAIGEAAAGRLFKEQYEKYREAFGLPGWEENCFFWLLEFLQADRVVQVGPDLLLFILENVGHELLDSYDADVVVRHEKDGIYQLLVCGKKEYLLDREAVIRQITLLEEQLEQMSGLMIAGYLREETCISGLHAEWKALLEMWEDNVMRSKGIFTRHRTKEYPAGGENIFMPMKRWEGYLEEGYTETVRAEIEQYLTGLGEKGRLNKKLLYCFYVDFVRMAGDVLEKKGISISSVIDSLDKELMYGDAIRSVPDMMGFVEQTLKSFQGKKDSEADICQRLKRYIREHIGTEMKRTDIASLVHMNPDYISRVFKKEMGVTINDYIISEKMNVARNLLQTTALPVSLVASRVGYDNFSHFSRTYKRVFGIAPSEERK